MLADLDGTPLESADEAVQLAVTVAAAYHVRGDTGQAMRTCRKAIARAEQLGTPKARAAAYWNASVFESERGSVAEAIPLAERALALLAEGQDGRNLARLRTALADMQLQLDPPEVAAAQRAARPGGRGAARLQRRRGRHRAQRRRPVPGRCCWPVTSRRRASSAPPCTPVREQSPLVGSGRQAHRGAGGRGDRTRRRSRAGLS